MITKSYQGISYTDQGKGKTLFFVHGFPLDQSLWSQQIKHFSKKFRTISINIPGLGNSTKSLNLNMELGDFAQEINILLEQLRVSDIILIGHSMGGFIALEFYKQYPKKVKALILADTKADPDTEEKRKKDYILSLS